MNSSIGFDRVRHVVADFVSFATTFFCKMSSLIHSVAPPFQTETAALGFGLVPPCGRLFCFLKPVSFDKNEKPPEIAVISGGLYFEKCRDDAGPLYSSASRSRARARRSSRETWTWDTPTTRAVCTWVMPR